MLNPEQQKAVDHLEGPLLVLAGAGSGKTKVVTARIAKLLERGVLPSEIVAITFTNKAADEMRERIFSLTHMRILALTFHSLCAKILRESIDSLGFRKDFTIYDDEDSLRLLKNCFQSLQIKEEKSLVKTIQNMISHAKNHLLLSPPSFPKSEEERVFSSLFPLYQKKLKECNAVDFDDLLSLTVLLFKNHPMVKEKFQKRWSFLLIDEYQDTNVAQYTLAKILSEKHNNLCAVGDPDQSIYSWRGASYENILHFDQDFPGATIIYLEQNYRSTENILSAANSLICQNDRRFKKNLWSTLGKGEKICIAKLFDEEKEASFILDRLIEHRRKESLPLEECVIFYRTNAQSRIFEDLLIQRKIPYIIYGGLSFYQRKEIKDLLSFLRLIPTDLDTLAFLRTINIPKRGFGKTTLERILNLSHERNLSPLSLCREIVAKIDPCISLSATQRKNLQHYLDTIDQIRNRANAKVSIEELLRTIMEKFSYLEYLSEDPETVEDRKENLNALLTKAIEWQETKKDEATLTLFLEELSLLSSVEEKKKESVRLMSLHNGKGLEFSLVFIAGLEEDLFPHIGSSESMKGIEEERRLCYVGMTRAKKWLYMTHAEYRFLWGTQRPMRASRFLKEISQDFVKKISPTSFEEDEEETSFEEKKFVPGNRVYHASFGVGIVQRAYTTSLGESYDVLFEKDLLTRSLIAKYAKLKGCEN
jgi:DNA helicase II / ATP-dependent DNA helicase PcrA